ncbi:MAG: hypothetical protein QF441_02690 [Bacteriovoracaceae bacterium]|jgi:hypothetical protein|nr:hypothetical protein [Bacteriovoracaceae bacterium]
MKYKIIVINDFFSQIEDPDVSMNFTKLMAMKRDGYWSKHNESYLPLSQDDFVGIHVLLVDEVHGDIIMAFKTTTKSICQRYRIKFPMDEYLEIASDIDKKMVSNFTSKFHNSEITYSGGWTINPKFKGFGLSNEFKEIYTAIHYHVHHSYNLNCLVAIGVVNFKTDEFFDKIWGMTAFTGTAYSLPSCPYLKCKFIHLDLAKSAEKKLELAEKYHELWAARQEFIVKEKFAA